MNPLQRFLIDDVERKQRYHQLRVQKRVQRDESDPFALPDKRFIELFRIDKDLMHYLFINLRPVMNISVRSTRLKVEERILVALRFFATGNYQIGVGEESLLSMSQQSVNRCIHEVAEVITNTLAVHWIQFPVTEQKKMENKAQFMGNTGFPGCIGAIDCTHIAIVAPREHEHNHVNRKSFHSKNVQLICNYNMEILNVNARYLGSSHDAFIWRASAINALMVTNYAAGERNTWLLRDSGYPQQPWLMTPIQGALPNSPEEAYNAQHSRAKSCVERCNGILKCRFRCLMGERKLRYCSEKVGTIINACCILHNICIRAEIPVEANIPHIEHPPAGAIEAELPDDVLIVGRRTRQELIRRYF